MDGLYKLIRGEWADVIDSRLSVERLCELRVRNGRAVGVVYGGEYYYLCADGITKDKSKAFVAGSGEAGDIIMRACERSLYTVTDTLLRGYIAVGSGIRIGVCGECVMSGGIPSAIKGFSAVVIRLPHEVKGCAATLYSRIALVGHIQSTLIVSPPGAGKTTVVRDLCRLISDGGRNVLLCDEKHELAAASGGVPTLDVGENTDVISGGNKSFAFDAGIANMHPDCIITDELLPSDIDGVLRALRCGVAVIATVHAGSIDELYRGAYRVVAESGAFDVMAFISPVTRAISVHSTRERA